MTMDHVDGVDALAWVIRLALGGDTAGKTPRDWNAVLRIARLERCVGLAWLRSGAFIRKAAPPALAGVWRRETAALDDAARRQFGALVRVVQRLEGASFRPAVLKGAPLSQRLYGDPFVRHSADLDLLVSPAERERAEAVLVADGWTFHSYTPEERTFRGEAEGMTVVLELHDSLTDDPLVSHFRFAAPPEERVDVEGIALPTLGARVLPSYLAIHLAKHTSAPLLWLIDFATLWNTLAHEERAAALAFARTARTHRVLRWALTRVAHLERASGADLASLARCGGGSALFREPHALRVNLMTAPTLTAAAALLYRWTSRRVGEMGTPRGRRGRFQRLERLAAIMRRVPAVDTHSLALPERTLRLELPASASLLRDVVSGGASALVVARGASMSPSIRSGARVRVAPFGAEGPRPGDVAVVETVPGEIVMHRIVALDDATVRLRGDNMAVADHPIDRSRLIGMATHVETANGARRIPRKVPGPVRRRLWSAQRRAQRLLGVS